MIDDWDYGKGRDPIDQIQAVEPRHEGTEVSEDVADRLWAPAIDAIRVATAAQNHV